MYLLSFVLAIAFVAARPGTLQRSTCISGPIQGTRCRVECGVDRPGGDYAQQWASSFDTCINLCDKDSQCTDAQYHQDSKLCYLKNRLTSSGQVANVDTVVCNGVQTTTTTSGIKSSTTSGTTSGSKTGTTTSSGIKTSTTSGTVTSAKTSTTTTSSGKSSTTTMSGTKTSTTSSSIKTSTTSSSIKTSTASTTTTSVKGSTSTTMTKQTTSSSTPTSCASGNFKVAVNYGQVVGYQETQYFEEWGSEPQYIYGTYESTPAGNFTAAIYTLNGTQLTSVAVPGSFVHTDKGYYSDPNQPLNARYLLRARSDTVLTPAIGSYGEILPVQVTVIDQATCSLAFTDGVGTVFGIWGSRVGAVMSLGPPGTDFILATSVLAVPV